MACGACGARKAGKADTEVEVTTKSGEVFRVPDTGAARRELALRGVDGTWKIVKKA